MRLDEQQGAVKHFGQIIGYRSTMNQVSKRLKALYDSGRGGSLRKLGDIAGVSPQTIKNWLDGAVDVSRIPEEPLRKLARHWRVDFFWLKYGEARGESESLDENALESAVELLEAVLGDMGASLPPKKKGVLLSQLYVAATRGELTRRYAESLVGLAL